MKKILLTLAVILLSGCAYIVSENEVMPQETHLPHKTNIVHITKFFDFQCSFCAQSNTTMKTVKNKFGDKVDIKYVHFPVKSGSRDIAEASECARSQNKFEEFKNEYFASYFGKSDQNSLLEIGKTIGLNQETFEICLKSDSELSTVDKNIQAGKKVGVQAVPYFLVEDQPLKGSFPFSVFEKIISSYLDKE